MTTDLLALPFDQYQRYKLVADVLRDVREPGERLTILDVGGRTALLRAFLPDDRVELVDVDPSDAKGLVLGDGSRLPFRSKSFDAVCAFDTLEHVPVPLRDAFVRSCARVAKRWVVLAGPYQAPAVEDAEKLLQSFLRDKLGIEHRYLEEHRHHGLPDRAQTEALLAEAGARVASVGHGGIERWLALMCAAMYLDHEAALRPLAARIFRFYNGLLHDSDRAEPVYRHAIVAGFDAARLPRFDAQRPPPAAPSGVLERFREVLAELVSFDRARDAWRDERAKLWNVVATLEKDLEGHRGSLAHARAVEVESKSVIAALERDLAAHKDTLAEAMRELADERRAAAETRRVLELDLAEHKRVAAELRRAHELELAARGREIEELSSRLEHETGAAQARIVSLEADLAGHRATIETLHADASAKDAALREVSVALERERANAAALARDLDAQRALAQTLREAGAALEADLAGHRAVVAELRGELGLLRPEHERVCSELHQARVGLGASRAEIDRAAELLRSYDAQVAELRRHLRSRVKSLRRALGPKRPTP